MSESRKASVDSCESITKTRNDGENSTLLAEYHPTNVPHEYRLDEAADGMTIHLPIDLESSIQAAILSGRFSSVDDAIAEAARLLLRQPPAPAGRPLSEQELAQELIMSGFFASVSPTRDSATTP